MKIYKRIIGLFVSISIMSLGLILSPFGLDNSLNILGAFMFAIGCAGFILLGILPIIFWLIDWFME